MCQLLQQSIPFICFCGIIVVSFQKTKSNESISAHNFFLVLVNDQHELQY